MGVRTGWDEMATVLTSGATIGAFVGAVKAAVQPRARLAATLSMMLACVLVSILSRFAFEGIDWNPYVEAAIVGVLTWAGPYLLAGVTTVGMAFSKDPLGTVRAVFDLIRGKTPPASVLHKDDKQ